MAGKTPEELPREDAPDEDRAEVSEGHKRVCDPGTAQRDVN